ncbi:MAG TPA: lytic murein transglycosylase [Gaiellaceae bacterium]|nr:lytic murein transglycosylase [Gaiellaceae bacterium]
MKRLALVALLVLATLSATARADTFTIVPTPVTPLAPDVTATQAPLPYSQLLGLWQQAGAEYDVPWQVLAAINKIESNFGRNMGPSSAGAIGWMQFMPATWLEWGVDANGDGIADPWNATDAIFSAARYLAAAGAATDLYRAVFAYNHADWYVNEVLQLADLYKGGVAGDVGNGAIAFSLDRMQQNLDAARNAVVKAATRLTAASATLRRLQAGLQRTQLLSDRLALEPGVEHVAATRDADARALDAAQRSLAAAQRASAAASFAPAAATLLAGPSYSSGYVFPVGGGPGVVSASHTHHDYPAVDIAAPLGSPVYALADGVVLRSWTVPDPKCGIGMTMRASDGQIWTYCHMAVLDPTVVPGASLSAGQQVGLVGATGDASGPHLHLQLQPPDAWPQQEAWFQSFAGTAFSWSDTASANAVRTPALVESGQVVPAAAPAAGPVFAVVQQQSQAPVVLFSRR